MTADEFARLVGDHVWHITATENLPGIHAHGLLRPSSLSRMAGAPKEALILRRERLQLSFGASTARLNSQEALRSGIKSAAGFLDGHTMESWSEQLDGRVFFWSKQKGMSFESSHGELGVSKLTFDARGFFEQLAAHIDLAPINTGSAKRKPTRRGDWIYVSAMKSAEDFRCNRIRLGEAKTKDDVGEISVRRDIPAAMLARMLVE